MNSSQIHSSWSFKRRQTTFHPSFLKKLRHVGTISEHTGCVNRLVWSDDGKVLASCSDDLHICLWNMEWKNTQPCSVIPTSHKNNIFCVKFIPQQENKIIVTGAMDSAVEVHTLADDLRSRVSGSVYHCHKAAVKYIEVEPFCPHNFFSVGEDGYVRQYDFRMKSLGCRLDNGATLGKVGCMYQSPNCLLKCKEKIKINSMKICATNTNLFVLATSENRVSVYDRRMLSISTPQTVNFHSSSGNPVVSFCPEHLLEKPSCYATYAEFSPCGKNILACFHSDHSYVFPLFDICNGGLSGSIVCSDETAAPFPWRVRSTLARDLRAKVSLAKEAVDVGLKAMDIGLNITSYNMFTRAIDISMQALAIRDTRFKHCKIPSSTALHDMELSESTTQVLVSALTNRANVCEKRRFVGDDVVGLMDLQQALKMHPGDVEVLVMKAKFLLNLHRPQEALIEVERIAELRNIDSNELIYIQNDVDTLRLKANFAIMDSMQGQNKNIATSGMSNIPPSSTQVDNNGLFITQSFKSKRNLSESAPAECTSSQMMSNKTSNYIPYEAGCSESNHAAKRLKIESNLRERSSSSCQVAGTHRLVANYSQRFVGASNIATDIKECVFVGSNGEYVAGGSDDGRFFVWDRFSGEILLCRSADPDVLSCLQPHPTLPIIATSGLDDSVRLWGPPNAKHLFKRLNRNDPFKLQCGKLELPELSRMRLQRPNMNPQLPPTHIEVPAECAIPTQQPERTQSSVFEMGQSSGTNRHNSTLTSDCGGEFALYHEAGLSSNGGSTSLTNSSQAGRAEQDECASGSTFSNTNCGNSTDSSDYGLVLDDSCSDFNELCQQESSVESEKPKRNQQKSSNASRVEKQSYRMRNSLKVDFAFASSLDVSMVESMQSHQRADGDSDSRGSIREGSSTTGDKISDSFNDEGRAGSDSSGNRSCPDAGNSSTKTTNTDSTIEEKAINPQNIGLNLFKPTNINTDSKLNINTSSLGDQSSDRTSGSVCDSSFSRSSELPGALNNLSSSISNSNNNSDQNSDTDMDGGSKHWSAIDQEANKPKQTTDDSLNLQIDSKIVTKKKRDDKCSSQNRNETVTNSSDSDSAMLKLAACGKTSNECLVNNTVSLSVYRRALQQAVEGLPMDADEALALEEIVAENQRLIKFNPSPLFYRQLSMNSNTAPSIALSSNASGIEPHHLSSLSHPTPVTNTYTNFNPHTQHNSSSIMGTALSETPNQSMVYYHNSCNPS